MMGAAGSSSAIVTDQGLITTIDVDIFEIFHSGWAPHVDGVGFDAGSDFWANATPFGSIADDTYTDGGSNTRVVESVYWDGANGGNTLQMSFDTTSIANTDTTFINMILDGTTYTRASSTYQASSDGGTMWRWLSVTPNPFGGTSGTVDFELTV